MLPVHCGEILEATEGKVGEWGLEPVWWVWMDWGGRPAAVSTRNGGREGGKTGTGGGLPMLPWMKYIAITNLASQVSHGFYGRQGSFE